MSRLRVTPIGTCRIHTPLRRGSSHRSVELDLRRNYGFVHTSAEALQQLRFLMGEKAFRPDVVPLVFRTDELSELTAQSWEPSDLHVVEISSAKRIRCGPDEVQGNYLQRHFPDFFASNERARQFWNIVKMGNRTEVLEFVAQQPSYRRMTPDERRLLTELSMEQQSFRTVKSDMAEIVERLGRDKVLFVTHVNAALPDGTLIASRDRLIRWVKLAAEQLGAACFDPTPLMQDVGQEQALENEGLDLTHYEPAFSDQVFDQLYRRYFERRMSLDGGPEEDSADSKAVRLATRLEAELQSGDFFAASRQVFAALQEHPDSAPLLHLRGFVRGRIGDYAAAAQDLTDQDDSAMSQPVRIVRAEALHAIGRTADALAAAQRMLDEEFTSAELYRTGAALAEQLGRAELAAAHAKQAFRLDRTDLRTGLQALKLLMAAGDADAVEDWRHELIDTMKGSAAGSFELASWALQNRDEDLFRAALAVLATSDKGSSLDLIDEAIERDLPAAAANSVRVLTRMSALVPGLAKRRAATINRMLELAHDYAEQGRAADAFGIARALAEPQAGSGQPVIPPAVQTRAHRLAIQVTREARLRVRSAYLAGDMADVARLGEDMGQALLADADAVVMVARALHAEDRLPEALALLLTAGEDFPDHAALKRWTGRFGVATGDYRVALDAYGSLRQSPKPEAEAFRAEADRFFTTAERGAAKRLRQLVDTGKVEDAVDLAEAMDRHLGRLERTERELKRLQRLLRVHARELEGEDREAVLRRLLRIHPDDAWALRRLALDLMRQFRFAEATDAWGRLQALMPEDESAARNRDRCDTLAKRRAGIR
ncbi:hypothetical protein [Sphingomonas arenae]|uniref:hypothetical protein n=1 Tax=Sphingomonas arenae TaxID=2812555 RepID=UPI0019680F48|nr:hypothetical protein [Sphingomonas arenae]